MEYEHNAYWLVLIVNSTQPSPPAGGGKLLKRGCLDQFDQLISVQGIVLMTITEVGKFVHRGWHPYLES